jgi:hypothetical protein
MLLEIAKNVSRKIDKEIWEGDGATGNLAGFIPALLLDVDVIDVASPEVITKANVLDELEKFVDTIPEAVLGSDMQVLGVSTNVLRALRTVYGALARANALPLATNVSPASNTIDFNGYTLTEIKGLNPNTMIAYNKENLFFGTGLLSDHNEIVIKDMDETDLSGMVRMKMTLTGGVQHAWGGEIVLYRG